MARLAASSKTSRQRELISENLPNRPDGEPGDDSVLVEAKSVSRYVQGSGKDNALWMQPRAAMYVLALGTVSDSRDVGECRRS